MGEPAVETLLRREVFDLLSAIEEQLKLTFFVVVLCPGIYFYHKMDSVEFSMALMGQTNAAIEISAHNAVGELAPPGKLRHSHSGILKYKWWTSVRKLMQRLSDERGWYWFVVGMENAKRLFVSESECFPLSPEMRTHLLEVVDVLWQESQMADVAHARDTFQRNYMEIARIAADQFISEYIGVEQI